MLDAARRVDRSICVLRTAECAGRHRSMAQEKGPREKGEFGKKKLRKRVGSMRAGRRQVAAGAVLLVCGVGCVLGRQDERERRKDIVDMVGPFHSLCACVCACVCAPLVDGVDPDCSCAKQRTGARSCASHKHTRCAGICPLPVLIPRCATQTLRVPRGGRLDTSLVARTNAAGPVRRMRRGGGVGIGGQPPPGYFWRVACVPVHAGFHRLCSTVARERC